MEGLSFAGLRLSESLRVSEVRWRIGVFFSASKLIAPKGNKTPKGGKAPMKNLKEEALLAEEGSWKTCFC